MLGMEDSVVGFVWIATVIAAVGCVIFGAMMWNRGGDDTQ